MRQRTWNWKLQSQSKLAYANDTQTIKMEAEDSPTNLNSKGAKRKEYKDRSRVGNHFTQFFDNNEKPRAKCNYCGAVYSGEMKSGTSTLWGHLNKCKSNSTNPPTDRTHLAFNMRVVETGEMKLTLQAWKFDQQKCRNAIAEMIIIDESPLKFVENEGFRRCMKMCQPALVPSRSTITRDSYQLCCQYEKLMIEESVQKKKRRKSEVEHGIGVGECKNTLFGSSLTSCVLSRGHKRTWVAEGVGNCLVPAERK
uniref:Zinc finger BED domain-containing protein DAYSLEEPER-like n=1 Tax=Tanacetum cinerariifolium TaxID=118510 RepID=A0A6L2KZG5_TANCI|nr:zinc finger BED domain-containing protein DAYSLEEPER-like [Tanacetum cinerariifolium]